MRILRAINEYDRGKVQYTSTKKTKLCNASQKLLRLPIPQLELNCKIYFVEKEAMIVAGVGSL
jgi:hypothetical protein